MNPDGENVGTELLPEEGLTKNKTEITKNFDSENEDSNLSGKTSSKDANDPFNVCLNWTYH